MNQLEIVKTMKAGALILGIFLVIAGIYFAFTTTPLLVGIGIISVGLLMMLLTRISDKP